MESQYARFPIARIAGTLPMDSSATQRSSAQRALRGPTVRTHSRWAAGLSRIESPQRSAWRAIISQSMTLLSYPPDELAAVVDSFATDATSKELVTKRTHQRWREM